MYRTRNAISPLVETFDGSREKAVFAVVVPVHNQGTIIESNLTALMQAMSMPFEIVCVDDASADGSASAIKRALQHAQQSNPNFCYGQLITSHISLFETGADCLGIASTRAPIILEVQADMRVTEKAFDRRLSAAFDTHQDVFLISGRGVEPIGPIASHFLSSGGAVNSRGRTPELHLLNSTPGISSLNRLIGILKSKVIDGNSVSSDLFHSEVTPNFESFVLAGGRAGRLGQSIEEEISLGFADKNKIWLGETVMRGPLAMRRATYDELGGLNERAFFLGFDDHDLALRGWLKGRYRSAYMPISFESPLENGTTRKRPNLRKILEIYSRMISRRRQRRLSALFTLNDSSTVLPNLEIRTFNLRPSARNS